MFPGHGANPCLPALMCEVEMVAHRPQEHSALPGQLPEAGSLLGYTQLGRRLGPKSQEKEPLPNHLTDGVRREGALSSKLRPEGSDMSLIGSRPRAQ